MKEITTKLRSEAVEGFNKFAEVYYNEGADQDDILRAFDSFTKGKIRKYYKDRRYPPRLDSIGFEINKITADSKLEMIFAELLDIYGIGYIFQYKIGPYTADFLLDGFLVVEIDGPHHLKPAQREHDKRRDDYMRNFGYKILRVPAVVLAMNQKAVIEEIKACLISLDCTRAGSLRLRLRPPKASCLSIRLSF